MDSTGLKNSMQCMLAGLVTSQRFDRRAIFGLPVIFLLNGCSTVARLDITEYRADSAQGTTVASGFSRKGTAGETVVVGASETLNSIASRYGTTPESIVTANGLTSTQLTPGQYLLIPPR